MQNTKCLTIRLGVDFGSSVARKTADFMNGHSTLTNHEHFDLVRCKTASSIALMFLLLLSERLCSNV